MELVSCLRTVNTPSYQHASPRLIDAAMAACVKTNAHEGEITTEDMDEFNDAVETVLAGSAALAVAYCNTIVHIAWDEAYEQNRITAGVATVELVLLAMTSHVEDEVLQRLGASALAGLAVENPVNIVGMLALGGFQTLITSAETHISAEDVQECVCCALCVIAQYSSEGKETLIAGRAVEVATRAKDLYPDLYWPDELLSILSAV